MKIIKKFYCTLLILTILIYSFTHVSFAASYSSQYFKETQMHPLSGKSQTKSGYDRPVYTAPTYKIPGLEKTDFIPQGLCEITYNNKVYHLITAYSYFSEHSDIYINENNEKNSRIYIIDVANQTHIKTVEIDKTIGKHFGGITEYKNKIVVVSTDCLYMLNKTDLFTKTKIKRSEYKYFTKEQLGTQNDLSFCTTNLTGKYLWIGTHELNLINATSNNMELSSVAKAFYYDGSSFICKGLTKIPQNCQGMCFDKSGNKTFVYFSVNYANTSELIRYRLAQTTYFSNGTFELNFYSTPSRWKTPLMMQEICLTTNSEIFALFESCSYIYKEPYINYKDRSRSVLTQLAGTRESNVVLIDM